MGSGDKVPVVGVILCREFGIRLNQRTGNIHIPVALVGRHLGNKDFSKVFVVTNEPLGVGCDEILSSCILHPRNDVLIEECDEFINLPLSFVIVVEETRLPIAHNVKGIGITTGVQNGSCAPCHV